MISGPEILITKKLLIDIIELGQSWHCHCSWVRGRDRATAAAQYVYGRLSGPGSVHSVQCRPSQFVLSKAVQDDQDGGHGHGQRGIEAGDKGVLGAWGTGGICIRGVGIDLAHILGQ